MLVPGLQPGDTTLSRCTGAISVRHLWVAGLSAPVLSGLVERTGRMDEVTIGVLALFGFLNIALTHGAKLARDIEEFIEAWRGPARSLRRWWHRRQHPRR
ncbi:hypothetical protein [Streptomyces sp. NPDC002779]|uniref:hypothetical protein n=1 Tax=Streptomyces sp. NPDC002779 TaxID=3364664 RepID=UPI00369225BA